MLPMFPCVTIMRPPVRKWMYLWMKHGRFLGVIGSRITGGGFGGCTVSIVKDASVDEFKEKLTKAYEEKVGKTPEFYVVSIGDGPSRLI